MPIDIVKTLTLIRKKKESELDQINSALRILSGGRKPPTRTLSAAARRRISKAQKQRWAVWHKRKAA